MVRCFKFLVALRILLLPSFPLHAQVNGDFSKVYAEIDFTNILREWDGFGFNYVQTAMSADYQDFAQDYGGFSILSEKNQKEIIGLVFGDNGLKPGLVKMFLDPLHQKEPEGVFDHSTTTKWMRLFVKQGLETTRARGDILQIITTLYGPPAWVTKQRVIRGRDIDPDKKTELAYYLTDWLTFLKNEGFPIRYLSLHNQGDKPYEYPLDGSSTLGHRTDYNGYWPPSQVVDFLKLLRPLLDESHLQNVGLTPGECSRWHYFDDYGYADAILTDEQAIQNLGLITCHGFHKSPFSEWFGEQRSAGTDILRAQRPDLHAWTTSGSFLDMSCHFVREIHGNIYTAKVNGYIPWAGIQRPAHWLGAEWNPGTAIRVHEDSSYTVERGYYYYKQVSRAGQPGMAVANTVVVDKLVKAIAFFGNNTKNPDAFVIMNLWDDREKPLGIFIKGSESKRFHAWRTTDDGREKYTDLGYYYIENGYIDYTAPPRSVVTFFAE